MANIDFFIIAFGVFFYGVFSRFFKNTIITTPMVFTVFGLITGPFALGWLNISMHVTSIRLIAEITLVLILFVDAARIDVTLLRKEHDIPMFLLLIGMPLYIMVGTLLSWFIFPTFTIWECALLASVLVPTDAALGQAVLTNKRVPNRIRQALSVESGLNDGLSLPFVFIFLAIADFTQESTSVLSMATLASVQLLVAPLIGIGVGFFGGRAIAWTIKSPEESKTFAKLSIISLALLSFSLTEIIGGSGFIATFCAGLTIGNTERHICKSLYTFSEVEGQMLGLITFLLFGAIMVPNYITIIDWDIVAYALLSLIFIRPLSIALATITMPMKGITTLFLGWFGPRGLTSVLFGLLIVERSGLDNGKRMTATIFLTVLFSIFLHGMTAEPGARFYARYLQKKSKNLPEKKETSEMPLRLYKNEGSS